MEELNTILGELAETVSENSDSSVPNDDDIVKNSNNLNKNQTANDHEKSNRLKSNTGGEDINQGFKVYSGYGGDYNPKGSMPGGSGLNPTQTPSTVPGTVQSWPEAAATWTSTARASSMKETRTVTAKPTEPAEDVWASTARSALATPREVGDCGRKHKRDTTDWGPGRGWNVSTLPVYRSPSSPCNRLFSGIKETRPGREPKSLLERFDYHPQQTPSRNTPSHLRRSLGIWNSSTSVSAPPTHRRKLHTNTETSSVDDGGSPGQRHWQQKFADLASATPPKNAALNISNGQHHQDQDQQSPASQLPKLRKEWKISTLPQWRNTVKWNQFGNIKDTQRPPQVRNEYTGVKAQYMKPSNKYL
ncbi:unnamed protein product [Calypogeia fissa]